MIALTAYRLNRLESLAERAADVEYDLDIARKTVDRLEGRTVELENAVDTLRDLLLDIREYMDQRADADCDQDGYIPNEEMKIAMAIDTTIALVLP